MLNKKHTILLIDDLPQNLVALKSVLEHPEREIITCLSAAEALHILLKTKVSLILVDVQMPDMDGFEFVEIIKQHPDTSHIPTIFVTAISNDPRFINQAYDLGAIDFLFKPLITEVTRKKVDSFLRIWDYDQELKKLNQKLSQKNAELEQFAYVIAHDLKSPLGNIQMLVELMEQNMILDGNTETLELFDMVKESSKNMSKLIEDLLHYSKNIQNEEDIAKVNIATTLEVVLKLLNPSNTIQINKVNLQQEIVFQPVALQQVLSNLLSNAIKYNDKEVPVITIVFDEQENTLTVKDNGPGIEEKHHQVAFEMFKTLGNTSQKESSTGIGLNLVKKLIERNNADIKIKSMKDLETECILFNLQKVQYK